MHPFTIRNRKLLSVCLLSLGALFIPVLGCSLGTATSGTSTPVPTATPDLTIYRDALDGSTKSDWADDSNCFFGAGGYHIASSFICYAPSDKVGDGVITVSVKQLTGPVTHAYGIVFRRPSQGNYYDFLIDSNGKWIADKVVNGTTTHLADFTANAAIISGLNQVNTLSVQTQGSHFVFSVNGTQVGTADDTTFAKGDTGLYGNDGIEVVFTNLLISKLPS